MLATTAWGNVWSNSRSPVFGMNCIGPVTRTAVATPTTTHRDDLPASGARNAHSTSVPRHGMNQTQWWLQDTGEQSFVTQNFYSANFAAPSSWIEPRQVYFQISIR